MKKKLVAVVLVVILSVAILTSCTLITLNDARDYNEVLAELSYEGLSATITKGEFLEYYSQVAPSYISQYQISAYDCVDILLNSLVRQEILLMEARLYFGKANGISASGDIKTFLSEDEINWITNRTNKQFKDVIKTELDSLVTTKNANIVQDEDALAARAALPVNDKYSTYIAGVPAEEIIFAQLNSDATRTDLEKKAANTIISKFTKSFVSKGYVSPTSTTVFDYYFLQQAESRLIAKFQEEKQSTLTVSDAEITNKYNLMLNSQKLKLITDSAYKTSLDGTETVLYHKGSYVKVNSILLKFSDEQASLLKAIQALFPKESDYDTVAFYRQLLVEGGNNANMDEIKNLLQINNKNLGLVVNESNVKYDAKAECKDENCTCKNCFKFADNKGKAPADFAECDKVDRDAVDEDGFLIVVDGCSCVSCVNNAYTRYNVPFLEVVQTIAEKVNQAAIDAGIEYDGKYTGLSVEEKALGKPLFVAQAKIDMFQEMIYTYNDDDGMFGGKSYIGTPEGKTSEYVAEYTAIIRSLMNTNQNKAAMYTDDTSYTLDGKVVEIFTTTATNADGSPIDGSKISYIINDFGVHIVMLTEVIVDTNLNADNITSAVINQNGKDETFYTLGLDAIIGFDSEKGTALTVRDTLRKSSLDAKKSSFYSNWTTDFFKNLYGDDILDKANKSKGIVIKNNVYEDVRNSKIVQAYVTK